ncbi:S8 family serine peptidase [Rudanella paleaurantiibacter]|uniref:S8 family serine peptidase n=2 Tax=Rudanella paleaurantiibacter TaxID=2614655 RepID=A0A7J5TVK8_9BACT|nr:S8 family serine peptidase [Rudanella paleaurantiibacter]KAB7728182.1 S8 family serine peptidase [Rudanella paleaurantiibacter]
MACQSSDRLNSTLAPATDCLVKASASNGLAISGQYIVTSKFSEVPAAPNARQASPATDRLVEVFLQNHRISQTQAHVLTATDGEITFVATLNPFEAEALWRDTSVQLLEPDRTVSLCACIEVASPSTVGWNIRQTGYGRGDRQTGRTAWVIDTGIDLDHPDLNVDTGRSRSFLSGATSASAEAEDNNGHGTHVAGIIGALNNNIGVTGVASGAQLVALKVLDQLGEGRLSGVIAAVDHVYRTGKPGDVVNLSLGGEGQSPTLDRVIRLAADRGILFAIAAGNESESVEGQSPARVNHSNVFTVSAMDAQDRFASFSNYGPSVDVAAYGVRIQSTYRNGRYATLSGTSMAAPHVAGLLYIRGNKLPLKGTVSGDPDGQPDPMAKE